MAIKQSFKLHTKGLIRLKTDLNQTKKKIYSCGIDSTIGIWKKPDDDEDFAYEVHNCLNDCQSVVAALNNDIYVGEIRKDPNTNIEQQVIVKYKNGGFESSSPLMTFTLEITALALSNDGEYLIAGSGDFLVKCLHLKNATKGYDRYEFDAPIVDVSIDPKNDFYSVSTADGNVQFRAIDKSTNIKTQLGVFKTCSSFSYITCDTPQMQVVWSLDGNYAFVPATGGVIVINCFKWTREKMLNWPDAFHDTFSVASLSETGEYLAACSLQGTLIIWKTTDLQPIAVQNIKLNSFNVTSIVFSPFEDNTIVAAYSEGFLGIIQNITKITSDEISNKNLSNTKTSLLEENQITLETVQKKTENLEIQNDSLSYDIIEDNSNETNNDNPIILNDDDNEVDLGLIKSQFGFIQDGVFVAKNSINYTTANSQNLCRNIEFSQANALPKEACTTIKKMKIPKIFVSGSTPYVENQRYLMWNIYGKIRSYQTEDESTIEINFHDATIHSEIVIDNTTNNYVFGDLNENLIALGAISDTNKQSKLYVYHVSSWDFDSREWSINLSNNEKITTLCVGVNFVAIFTSLRFVRIFTAAGTQRIVSSLPGPILTICAYKDFLVAVRLNGGIIITSEEDYEHQLTAEFYKINVLSSQNSTTLYKSLPICIGPNTNLKWISFSNLGRLVTMDSDCIIRLYSFSNNIWIPILIGNTLLKEIDSDYIWPISVHERPTPIIRYIYCKNSTYPSCTKSIIPTSVSWTLPIMDMESEKGKLESQLLLAELLEETYIKQVEDSSINTNELAKLIQNYSANLIKLFALSFNVGRENRALDLAYLTKTAQGIQLMCNYAAKKERPNLSEKIATIGREKLFEDKTAHNIACTSSSSQNLLVKSKVCEVSETKENHLMPSTVRLKRKLNSENQLKNSNKISKTSISVNDDSENEIFEETPNVNLKKNLLKKSNTINDENDVNVSQISSLMDSTINFDVSLNSTIRNPFKQNTNNADNSNLSNEDFFDQLSKTKTINLFNENNEKTLSKSKRQSKLSFQTTIKSDDLNTKPLNEISTKTKAEKRTGFDLWSDKYREKFFSTFDGDQSDFQLYLIQNFRALSSDEKKKWNEQAKAL